MKPKLNFWDVVVATVFAVFAALFIASVALGGDVCHAPAYVPVYTPAAQVVIPTPHYQAKEILFADVYVPLFDVYARDTFVFYGPPAFSIAPQPGPTAGVDESNREMALAPVPQKTDGPRPLAGYEGEERAAPKALPKALPKDAGNGKLASLVTSCAECHMNGKSKGGFSLDTASVDWAKVATEITTGRMPPLSSGKPAVPADDVREIRRRAGM